MSTIIYQIASAMYLLLAEASVYLGFNLSSYYLIWPNWFPKITNGIQSYITQENGEYVFYIELPTMLKFILVGLVWYMVLFATWKFLKKLFSLGFGAFGL